MHFCDTITQDGGCSSCYAMNHMGPGGAFYITTAPSRAFERDYPYAIDSKLRHLADFLTGSGTWATYDLDESV